MIQHVVALISDKFCFIQNHFGAGFLVLYKFCSFKK